MKAKIVGHPRRMFIQQYPLFVTNRLAQGLPFVPNEFINNLIFGILARAANLYPGVTICGALFLGNHYHLVILPESDPSEVASFMNFFDGELAKMVKRILGIQINVKIWAQRYHAAVLADPEAVIKKLAYLYANPVAANLVDRAEEWFGITTFNRSLMPSVSEHKYFRPSKLPILQNAPFSKTSIQNLLRKCDRIEGPIHQLNIDPLAWLKPFSEHIDINEDEARSKVLEMVNGIERQEKIARKKANRTIPNRQKLQFQNPHKEFVSKEFGRRVFCICSSGEVRTIFIELYKEFCQKCVLVWRRWKVGDLSPKFPPGAFLPPRMPLANLIPFRS